MYVKHFICVIELAQFPVTLRGRSEVREADPRVHQHEDFEVARESQEKSSKRKSSCSLATFLLTFSCYFRGWYSLNSRDSFLNLRRLVKMTKPLRLENKSLRLKYKCLICIWIIFWAILYLFINPKYLFQNKSFSQTYYFKSEKSFVILTSLLGLKINPGNLESSQLWTRAIV